MRLTLIRRLTQLSFMALLLLMPVFNILRYDVDTKELFVFGQVWSIGLSLSDTGTNASGIVAWRFFIRAIIPWLIALSVFPVLGFFLGRFFCGWFCPEGTLFELADFLNKKISGRSSLWQKDKAERIHEGSRIPYIVLAIVSLIFIPPLMGAGLTGYFISPERIWRELLSLSPSFGVRAGIIGVSVYIFITSVFVRHILCKYICAAGLMQMLFGWISPISLRLKFLRHRAYECTDCKRCEEVCFMNVKPRKNQRDISCINCGACIEACNRELTREGEGISKGLFQLKFGKGFKGETTDKKEAVWRSLTLKN